MALRISSSLNEATSFELRGDRAERFNERHIAQTDERHVQRARNGVALRASASTLRRISSNVLVRDSEALLFVDDEQTEIRKTMSLKQRCVPMTTSTFRLQFGKNFLCSAAERKRLNISIWREGGETALERFEVLECEDGVGRGPQPVCHPRQLERRAHRDSSYRNNIAQAAIHGRFAFHVALDVRDSRVLVVGLFNSNASSNSRCSGRQA